MSTDGDWMDWCWNKFSHNWGQTTSSIVTTYASAGDTVGVAEAFANQGVLSSDVKRPVAHIGSYAAYDLVETISGQSVLDILEYCRDQPRSWGNDSAWDGARVVGYTSAYSGTQYGGSLLMGSNSGDTAPDYFFMCGVTNLQTMINLFWRSLIIPARVIGGVIHGEGITNMVLYGHSGMEITTIVGLTTSVMDMLKDMLVIKRTVQPIVVHMRYSFDRLCSILMTSFVTVGYV